MQKNALKALGVIGILALFLSLSVPGLGWGTQNGTLSVFYPDEYTHAELARNFATREIEPHWYVKGYSTQAALMSFLLLQKNYLGPEDPENNTGFFVMAGRLVSLAYGIAVLMLVFAIGNHFGGFKTGFFAALTLTVLDLFVSFSHLAVPESASVFWFWLALFLAYLAHKKPSNFRDLSAMVASAVCFSIKFNFAPLIALLAVFLHRKSDYREKAFTLAMMFFVFVSVYWIANGSIATYSDISLTLHASLGVNFLDEIPDKNAAENPLLFMAAIIAGSSLVTVLGSVLGAKKFYEEKKDAGFWLIMVLPLAAWLGILSLKPNVFPRFLLVSLPLMALFAGFFVKKMFEEKRSVVAAAVAILLIAYPLGLTLVSQGNFVKDNRFEAYEWIGENTEPGEKILAGRYFYSDKQEPPPALGLGEADYIVLHEFYYGRYVKKFTTGLAVPECVSGVHHPTSMENCEAVQKLVLDTGNSGYSFAKEFRVTSPFPERSAFTELFGMYTPNAGNILIFRKN